MCVWPNDFQKSSIGAIIKFIVNISAGFLMSCVVISNILCIAYKAESNEEKFDIMGPTFFYGMSTLKYFLFLYRAEALKKSFEHLEEDWMYVDTKEREIMLKNAKFGRIMSIYFAIFLYSGGAGHHFIKPFLSDSILTEMNISVKPFPSPVYGGIFNTGYSPLYEFTFAAVIIADMFIISMAPLTFNITAILLIHACGQFEIINLNLHDVVSGLSKKESTAQERLVAIIKSHIRHFTIKKYYQTINNFFAFSYVSYLDKVFCEIFLVEILGCAINLSLLGYFSVTNWKAGNLGNFINFAILLNVFIFNIFIYAYFGELLTIQAEKVGNTGYMIEWHKLPRNISLELSFFIQVCQFPIRVTAGKVVFLSMTTFTAIIKSAAAYLNIIWKM
ncbi:odorant receptor 13a-like [Leptopilina heterotoma]|uniref:odorant receptor 13a-like n=1 Tax=Leptopilina heterotoma TaxID=63436 RepID=UPI001CA973D8|nr:odorant receptor 13a-like [Leptopilina heterotoma]